MCCMCYMFLTHWSLLPNPWILRWHVSCIKINLNKILRIYEHLLILLSLAMFHTISHQQWLHSADGLCVFLIRMTILAYVDHEFLFKIQNMTRKPAFYPHEIHGFPVRNSPSIFHCHQGSASSAVGLVVNTIPFLYLWACCACFTERPKVRSSKWYLPWPQHVEHVATCCNLTLQFDDAHLPTIVDTHTSGCLNWQAHHLKGLPNLRSFETQLLVPWTSHWLETLESFDGKPFPCESWIVPSVGARLSAGEHLGTRPMIAELHIPSWPTYDTLPE